MTDGLKLEGLSAGYGQYPVTFDISLEVKRGEIVALIGPNGAGKSTTLLAASGLVETFAGSVSVDGASLDRVAAHRRAQHGMVHVPEDRSLFFDLTVDENLALVSGGSRGQHAYAAFPELAELRKRRAGLLSGGEQQMLTIGRGLEMTPKYLMVDEMSLGLAPVIAQRVLARLTDLVRNSGLGLLIVEQNVDIALEFADRVYLLAGGRVRFEGASGEVRTRWDAFRDLYFQ